MKGPLPCLHSNPFVQFGLKCLTPYPPPKKTIYLLHIQVLTS
uniref:Uncharacterized protein n=1 Tax=Anguilla anguilla TaxID=7936 RepID=A0A0E9Q8G6_ANGAN